MPFFFSLFTMWCWSAEGEHKGEALCRQGRAFLPPHQTDPGSDAWRKHLGHLFGSGLSKGSLKAFSENAEYVPLQRFELRCWGLPVALEKLCSDCFHPAVSLFEVIWSNAVTLLVHHLQSFGSAWNPRHVQTRHVEASLRLGLWGASRRAENRTRFGHRLLTA